MTNILFIKLVEDFDHLVDQVFLISLVADRLGNTTLQVVFQDHHSERADCAAGRSYLLEDSEAISVLLHHISKTSNLPLDPIKPVDEFLVIITT